MLFIATLSSALAVVGMQQVMHIFQYVKPNQIKADSRYSWIFNRAPRVWNKRPLVLSSAVLADLW